MDTEEQGMLVYAVDDDVILSAAIADVLSEHFRVLSLGDARACFEAIQTQAPDLLILDQHLPDGEGVAICAALRTMDEMADVPIIFLSGDDSIELRLAGYEAGAQDFIVKPFDGNELLRKVQVITNQLSETRRIKSFSAMAQNAAFSAMSSMSELGAVMQFLRNSFACQNEPALASAMIEAMAAVGMQSIVQIRQGARFFNVNAQGATTPLESSILAHACTMGRVFQFKRYGAFNYGDVTLLITTMPIDDESMCGRLRDHGATVVEAAEARIKGLRDANFRIQQSAIDELIRGVNESIAKVEAVYAKEKVRQADAGFYLRNELSTALVAMGVTEAQEDGLLAIFEKNIEKVMESEATSMWLFSELDTIQQRLSALRV